MRDGLGSHRQVVQEGQAGAISEADDARLFEFGGGGLDVYVAELGVNVVEGEGAGLGDADAGVKQEEDDGLIAQHQRAGDAGPGFVFAVPGLGVFAGVEQGLDLFLREDLDGRRLGFADFDGADDVGGYELALGCPAPEG